MTQIASYSMKAGSQKILVFNACGRCLKFKTNQCSKPILETDAVCSDFKLNPVENGRLEPYLLHHELQEHSGLALLTMRDNEDIFGYDKSGCWRPDGEIRIKEHVEQLLSLDPSLSRLLTVHLLNEVIERVRWSTYSDRDVFRPPPGKICVKNGVLELETGLLEPHSSTFGFLNSIPVTYDPAATCPTIDRFITEVAGDYVQTLYEIAGYCLLDGNKHQKGFLFIGFGDNGKSTFCSLLKAFLGPENISTIPLQELEENRFSKAELYGKKANIFSDISSRGLYETGSFKTLTGEDTITAEHKFQKPFQFINNAKLIFSCNIVPESKDDSDAFFRRWILIPFLKTIHPDKKIKNFLERLTTEQELSGFLNKAMAAYKDLEQRGSFTNEGNVEDIRKLYVRLSDPIGTYIDERIELDEPSFIVKQQLFQDFTEYCKVKKYAKNFSQKTFFKAFLEKVPAGYIQDTRENVEGSFVRVFKGIRLAGTPPTPQTVLTEGAEKP